uniref:Uncharacterized protein n=1 Tax=Hyaloperonospora arabidopsidis (strain Emoy2) TaxID=559515 RepID=M4BUS3_HYAAE
MKRAISRGRKTYTCLNYRVRLPSTATSLLDYSNRSDLRSAKNPEQARVLLSIDAAGGKILDSPNLGTWYRFTRAYNEQKDLPITTSLLPLITNITEAESTRWRRSIRTSTTLCLNTGLTDPGGQVDNHWHRDREPVVRGYL